MVTFKVGVGRCHFVVFGAIVDSVGQSTTTAITTIIIIARFIIIMVVGSLSFAYPTRTPMPKLQVLLRICLLRLGNVVRRLNVMIALKAQVMLRVDVRDDALAGSHNISG